MISEYHRARSPEHALELLARSQPRTLPLGGGTTLSRSDDPVAVVDLQDLEWDRVEVRGGDLWLGATCKLTRLRELKEMSAAMKAAIQREGNLHLQNMATLAGALVTADGRSALLACLLAAGCQIHFEPRGAAQPIDEWLAQRAAAAGLIREIQIPLEPRLQLEMLGRSPLDRPHLIVAAAQWPSGRLRVAAGGLGGAPVLAFDGTDLEKARAALAEAFRDAEDAWASAEFRQSAAGTILERMFSAVG